MELSINLDALAILISVISLILTIIFLYFPTFNNHKIIYHNHWGSSNFITESITKNENNMIVNYSAKFHISIINNSSKPLSILQIGFKLDEEEFVFYSQQYKIFECNEFQIFNQETPFTIKELSVLNAYYWCQVPKAVYDKLNSNTYNYKLIIKIKTNRLPVLFWQDKLKVKEIDPTDHLEQYGFPENRMKDLDKIRCADSDQ